MYPFSCPFLYFARLATRNLKLIHFTVGCPAGKTVPARIHISGWSMEVPHRRYPSSSWVSPAQRIASIQVLCTKKVCKDIKKLCWARINWSIHAYSLSIRLPVCQITETDLLDLIRAINMQENMTVQEFTAVLDDRDSLETVGLFLEITEDALGTAAAIFCDCIRNTDVI